MKKIGLMIGSAALAALALASPASAATSGVKLGLLVCNVSSGWGFVFGSSKELNCNYRPNDGQVDRYVGSISKFGVDIGYTSAGVIVWEVLAPTSDIRAGALEGEYIGGTAGATVVGGVAAHALIGGLDKSITLQPLSLEGNKGLNVAAGIGQMSLKAAPPM